MYKKHNKNIPVLINTLLTEENLKKLEQSSKWILNYYLNQIDITTEDYE